MVWRTGVSPPVDEKRVCSSFARQLTAETVPTLDEALTAVRGRGVLAIDLKSPVRDRVVQRLRERGSLGDALLIVYSEGALRDLVTTHPDVCVSAPATSMTELEAILALHAKGACIIAFAGVDAFDPRIVQALRAADVSVQVGTFAWRDAAAEQQGVSVYADLWAADIDVLATNHPDWALSAVPSQACPPP